MKRPVFLLFLLLAPILVLISCVPPDSQYGGPSPYEPEYDVIGRVTRVIGPGHVQINNQWVSEGAVMRSGDHIRTVGDARATLALARGGEVHFDADTDPILEWLSTSFCKLRIVINIGSMLVDSRCQTETRTGSGAVIDTIGTIYNVKVSPYWTELTVLEGSVSVRSNVGGAQVVRAGYQCLIERNRPAARPVQVNTLPAVDWACRLNRSLCQQSSQPPPPPYSTTPYQISVPSLTGLDLAQAQETLRRHKLEQGRIIEKATDNRNEHNQVARQSPKKGATVTPGTTVELTVWRYQPAVQRMPYVIRKPFHEARKIIEDAGIPVNPVPQERHTDKREKDNLVTRQFPEPGTKVPPGTVAVLTVYRYLRPAERLVQVPDVRNMHIDRARAVLEEAGLQAGETFGQPTPSRTQANIVHHQDPAAGSRMDRGGKVNLWIYTQELRLLNPPILRPAPAPPPPPVIY